MRVAPTQPEMPVLAGHAAEGAAPTLRPRYVDPLAGEEDHYQDYMIALFQAIRAKENDKAAATSSAKAA